MKKLNPLQLNYLQNVKLLQSLNYPTNVLDKLYIENFKSKK